VADAKRAVALAGVMGGWDHHDYGKNPGTYCRVGMVDPVSVRKTARRHGLPHMTLSHRFERGADFESTVPRPIRVAQLILESGAENWPAVN